MAAADLRLDGPFSRLQRHFSARLAATLISMRRSVNASAHIFCQERVSFVNHAIIHPPGSDKPPIKSPTSASM
jgi:hypothetical protein